jgi:hypothetical protein
MYLGQKPLIHDTRLGRNHNENPLVSSLRRSDPATGWPPASYAEDRAADSAVNCGFDRSRRFADQRLPKALPEWQTAIGCLIGAAERRDFLMHARVGMLRALNRHRPKAAPAPATPALHRKRTKVYKVIQ